MTKASDWAMKKLKGHFNKKSNVSKVSEITKAAKEREEFYKQYGLGSSK
tara:strand:+ start:614 stop:760 length:147 start_codon:yes stop_codon:yes gene_type:complete